MLPNFRYCWGFMVLVFCIYCLLWREELIWLLFLSLSMNFGNSSDMRFITCAKLAFLYLLHLMPVFCVICLWTHKTMFSEGDSGNTKAKRVSGEVYSKWQFKGLFSLPPTIWLPGIIPTVWNEEGGTGETATCCCSWAQAESCAIYCIWVWVQPSVLTPPADGSEAFYKGIDHE